MKETVRDQYGEQDSRRLEVGGRTSTSKTYING